jgi:hypothetical protein
MNLKRSALTTLAAACAAFASAHAAPITVNAIGVVTQVLAADAFGTTVGNQFALRATFDSGALIDAEDWFGVNIPGLQFASLADDPESSLLIQLGARSWTAMDEPSYGNDFGGFFPAAIPHVVLLNGAFFGLDYFGIGPSDDTILNDALSQLLFGAPLGEISGGDSDPNHPPTWIGKWDIEHATVAVPEPNTLAIVMLGIAGMTFQSVARRGRRRRSAGFVGSRSEAQVIGAAQWPAAVQTSPQIAGGAPRLRDARRCISECIRPRCY